MTWIEILGYAASVLVAASLSMKSVARLRFLNLLGALAFTLYGLLLKVYPVLAVNAYIAVVNIVFLMRMRPGRSEAFELLAIADPGNRYLVRFLDFHNEDIRRFFPHFGIGALKDPVVVFILRDMLPVGLVIGRYTGRGTFSVDLDYVIPSHRDFRCAEYFYRSWRAVLGPQEVRRFLARTEVEAHRRYLSRLGFRPAGDEVPGWYERLAG